MDVTNNIVTYHSPSWRSQYPSNSHWWSGAPLTAFGGKIYIGNGAENRNNTRIIAFDPTSETFETMHVTKEENAARYRTRAGGHLLVPGEDGADPSFDSCNLYAVNILGEASEVIGLVDYQADHNYVAALFKGDVLINRSAGISGDERWPALSRWRLSGERGLPKEKFETIEVGGPPEYHSGFRKCFIKDGVLYFISDPNYSETNTVHTPFLTRYTPGQSPYAEVVHERADEVWSNYPTSGAPPGVVQFGARTVVPHYGFIFWADDIEEASPQQTGSWSAPSGFVAHEIQHVGDRIYALCSNFSTGQSRVYESTDGASWSELFRFGTGTDHPREARGMAYLDGDFYFAVFDDYFWKVPLTAYAPLRLRQGGTGAVAYMTGQPTATQPSGEDPAPRTNLELIRVPDERTNLDLVRVPDARENLTLS